MQVHSARRGHIAAAVFIVGIAMTGVRSAGQATPTSDLPGEVAPPPPGANGDRIFAELVRQNELRTAHLQEYSAVRTYSVTNLAGKLHAKETVRMEFIAPDKKTFVTTSEEGSYVVRHMVLNGLIESEISTSVGKQHRDSSITPANYTFHVMGQEEVGDHHCLVVQALPRREDKYLFQGKVWIDDREFAIVKIAGHPANRLSFWITHADFIRQYEKIGGFWLPVKDETIVDVRIYGKKILTIEHHVEMVNGIKSAALRGNHPTAGTVSEESKAE